uniref:ligase-associated DNA damage response endonuclease PdeM n=1 Tax=Pararhizobium sp. IMCC3301 TaxID=3067904 RepID=UPI002741E3EB|nr:ligase-associated DNA damage response endonuclease PdeM [Pararhizobium sp. IMCC3301]
MTLAENSSEPMLPQGAEVTLMGETFLAHPHGILYWPGEATLIVADLHLEKGSSFARKGTFLPPYDSRITLGRLATLVEELRPDRLIALGDSFHDVEAANRLGAKECATVLRLQQSCEWIWVSGNHDPYPPVALGGHACDEMTIGPITFRHEPLAGAKGEIAGHLHPCSKVRGRARSVRRACFIEDGDRAILPAFGALTGGLNICDDAFTGMFGVPHRVRIHMLGDQQIYTVDRNDCRPDARRA